MAATVFRAKRQTNLSNGVCAAKAVVVLVKMLQLVEGTRTLALALLSSMPLVQTAVCSDSGLEVLHCGGLLHCLKLTLQDF